MTRVMIGDRALQLAKMRHPFEQQRAEVAHFRLNLARVVRGRIIFQDRAILGDRGRASRGGRNDRIGREILERADIGARESDRARVVSGMQIEGATTCRRGHLQHAISRRSEESLAVAIFRIGEHLRDASMMHDDARRIGATWILRHEPARAAPRRTSGGAVRPTPAMLCGRIASIAPRR